MSYEIVCPECEGPLTLQDPIEGEIVPCACCGVDLEVVSLQPLSVDLAPEVEEDWG